MCFSDAHCSKGNVPYHPFSDISLCQLTMTKTILVEFQILFQHLITSLIETLNSTKPLLLVQRKIVFTI